MILSPRENRLGSAWGVAATCPPRVDSGTPFMVKGLSVDLAPGADRSRSLKKKERKKIAVSAQLGRFGEARRAVHAGPGTSRRPRAEKTRVAAICEVAADRMPHNYDISWGKLACNARRFNIATRASHDKAPWRFEGKLARCKCVSRRSKVKTTWKKIKGFGQ